MKRKNIIFERARFNQRQQAEGESVDDFVMDLYRLAEHCGYGVLHNEMIRDRIVVGLRDAKLSEKLQPSPLLRLPWQKVGTDLFEWNNAVYLLIVDYYSRWIEVAKLAKATAAEVVRHTSSIFARHGIPELVISDNGPQYTAECYAHKYK